MDSNDISAQRITNQRLAGNGLETPQEVVKWLGAVQAQDFAMSKWALGLRMMNASDAGVEEAFSRGDILRTHAMRPTWHFVTPADLRWMLTLTGPRVLAGSAGRHRQLELDEDTFSRSREVFTRVLAGGKALTRYELRDQLEVEGIFAGGQRMPHILMNAEMVGTLVSGPRKGKQHTYMLLEERVPSFPILSREEAIGELTRRYFRSHGPATVRDYCWWSGLIAADARAGIAMNDSHLAKETIDRQTYWYADSADPAPAASTPAALLLPVYDEMMVGHTDRSAHLERLGEMPPDPRNVGTMQNLVLVNNQIVGTWARAERKDRIEVRPTLFIQLSESENAAVEAAIRRFGNFYGLPAVLVG